MKEEQSAWPWAWLLVRGCLALAAALLLVLTAAGSVPDGGWDRTEAVCCAAAGERYLVPVGQTVGIKLFARGVMVVGLSEVNTQDGTCSPAQACGLKTGDIITHINSQEVDTIEQVQEAVQSSGGELEICATRSGRRMTMTAQATPCLADGSYKLGAWIRDSMAGIGTITFYDPATGAFAALGHGINDVDTGLLMPLSSGAIMPSSVSGVVAGEKGSPGALHGSFDLTRDLGALTANTDRGIFGTLAEDCFGGEVIPVARRSEVQTGAATILANVSGETVEEYAVEILRVYPASAAAGQSLMLRVTDERLLAATGGIVQGMSGSPIIQNGKLVGAVTHVLVNDPARGDGSFIEDMLEAAG